MVILCTIRRIRPQPYIVLKNICRAIKVVRSQSTVDLSHTIYGPSPKAGGEAIFVLHGLLGCKHNWNRMCGKIAAHTKKPVIAVDARNHGDSPHSDAHDYTSLAADVSQLASKLSLKKYFVLGHTMGGKTGMVLALTEPSKVASLIVVDISSLVTPENSTLLDFFPKLINAMIGVDFKGSDTLDKAKTAAKKKIAESQLFPNEESMHFVLMNIGQLPDNSFGWKSNVKTLQKNLTNIASFPILTGQTYDGPTLFIAGKQSNLITPEDLTGIRKTFPKAKMIFIEGAGHNVHSEKPNDFLNAVVQFIS